MKTIVACKCSCACGSNGLEFIICVHILPCIELLGYFLKEALAEHLLIELCHYVKKNNMDLFDPYLLSQFREYLEILLITCRVDEVDEALNAPSLREMLCAFDVGTDKRKFGPPPPQEPKEIGPLIDTNLQSTKFIARQIRTGNVSKIQKKSFQRKIREPMTYELYKQTLESCSTFCALLPKSSTTFLCNNMVGYRLLELRCEGKLDFSKLKKYDSCTKAIKIAIEQAQSEYRYSNKKYVKTTKQTYNNTNTTIRDDDDDDDDSSNTSMIDDDDESSLNTYLEMYDQQEEVTDEEQEIEIIETMNTGENINNQIRKKTCCARGCKNTSKNKPNANWYNVPFPKCQPIKVQSNDMMRRKFALSKYHRELYLKRL